MAETDLNPIDLRSFINKDRRYERAEALIKGAWEDLLLSQPWGMTTINMADVQFAEALLQADLVQPVRQRFDTFADVQQFIQQNSMRLTPDVVTSLKSRFDM
ncbi:MULTISPECIES: hypothetical protein [Weissella]|jgi:TnpA family transposase|uniref:Uncharacterized protein n=1 Tax=Weissella cibaria TaxID=137591 RepID=A0A0D1LWM7_9LACO|nr:MULTISPECIES: hypothetical protein [Weissella]ALI32023.1 hypothetical protein AO080_00415 [Weissella cibaria]APS26193.1 hypothetical protein AUC63_00105 [Weissella cibaria]APU63696.1 hypothetical protein AUC65_01933 [Weissella cibaria]APU65846.1 hypothetical protein AUC62_01925 [Weissella cibaria]ASS52878.1 hypothetical protein CHR48_01988 [Weissella cibaria]